MRTSVLEFDQEAGLGNQEVDANSAIRSRHRLKRIILAQRCLGALIEELIRKERQEP